MRKMTRQAKIDRKTKETDIKIKLDIDGRGKSKVDTGIPFMDHMLTLFAGHGFMDLEAIARGDTRVDDHHTVEDLGICMGMAVKEALAAKKGIRRYGEATIPMDESLARVVVDLSNRPNLAYRVRLKKTTTGSFDVGLVKEFFRALVTSAGISMHVDLIAGEEPHHISEAIFKAFARALDQACGPEERLAGEVPSTKGVL
ncbi:Imidazoleglycerol-phosphate dehydratase [uncultured Desulfobacterium sp.]|uniref:Imidazoleglycerol-phosphate dehydratase n=1 Tax=uncultured Desulfobacterium sp. TaxID=201089 RepID=A0A445MTG9_9BACT|nr:Imidazoleglycerol-phosphate dehydratase [uncultured Desulfobacterium sp.]